MYNFYKSTNDYCETLDNYIGKIILSSNKLVTNYDNNNFITKDIYLDNLQILVN